MHLQAAARGTKAADHRCRRVRRQAHRHLPQAERARALNQVRGERPVELAKDIGGNHGTGMRGGTTARKKRNRSANSPARELTNPIPARSEASSSLKNIAAGSAPPPARPHKKRARV